MMWKAFLSKASGAMLLLIGAVFAGSMAGAQASDTTQDAICAGLERSLPRIDIREAKPALRRGGWRVLRFWNNDILQNRAGVLESIAAALGPYIATEPPP